MSIHCIIRPSSTWNTQVLDTTEEHRNASAHHSAGHYWAAARALSDPTLRGPHTQAAAAALVETAWFEAFVRGEREFAFDDYSLFPFNLIRETAAPAAGGHCPCTNDGDAVDAVVEVLADDRRLAHLLSGIERYWRHIGIIAEVLKAGADLSVEEAATLLSIDLDSQVPAAQCPTSRLGGDLAARVAVRVEAAREAS